MNSQTTVTSSAGGFWPPPFPSVYVSASGTTTTVPAVSFVPANNSLTVTLKDTNGQTVDNACVGVKMNDGSGSGNPMKMQNMNCQQSNIFTFQVPTSTVTVVVNRPGQTPVETPVAITAGTVTSTIILSAPSAYITVTAKDSNGTLSGVSVFAQGGPSGFAQSLTGSGGTTTLYVAPGTYTVGGFAPSFGPLQNQSVTLSGSSASVTLSPASGLGTISGAVTGSGNSGLMVTAQGIDGTNGGNNTQTDGSGLYKLQVPSGTYQVKIWSPAIGGFLPPITKTVGANTTVVIQPVAMPSLGMLHVVVNNAQDVGQMFAHVSGGNYDSWTNSWTATSTNAEETYFSLPSGSSYTLNVGSPAFAPFTTTTPTVSGVTDVTVDAKNLVGGNSFVTLSGSVTTTAGGLANATVWASRVNSTAPGFYSTQTDDSGNYSLSVPENYLYNVGVNALGYVAPNVTSSPSGATVINFGMSTASVISGVVKATGGTGIANAWVTAKNSDGTSWGGASTDANGNYSINVGSGNWTLYAEGPCYQRSAGVSVAAGSSQNITLTAVSGCTLPTTQMMGVVPSSGGQVANGNNSLLLPPNSLGTGSSAVNVTMSTGSLAIATANATPVANSVQTITAVDSSGQPITSLNTPANLTINYDPSQLPSGFDASNLQMAYFDVNTGQWDPVAATVNTSTMTLTASVNHFTNYAAILPSVPAAPAALTATGVSNSGINLSWNASPNADYYVVYRSTDGVSFSQIATNVVGTSYSDSGLNSGTTYYYEVAGYNSSGLGPNATASCATTNQTGNTGGGSGPQIESSGGGGGGGFVSAPLSTPSATTSSTTVATTPSAGTMAGAGVTTTIETTATIAPTAMATKPHYVFSTALKLGSTGTIVSDLQQLLKDLGYFSYPSITKYYGPATRKAVEAYQKAKRLKETGVVDDATRTALNSEGAGTVVSSTSTASTRTTFTDQLYLGSTGEQVRQLQGVLKSLGYFDYPSITGYFGPVTKAAVVKFQEAKGLKPYPGWVGPGTRQALNNL